MIHITFAKRYGEGDHRPFQKSPIEASNPSPIDDYVCGSLVISGDEGDVWINGEILKKVTLQVERL